MTFHPRLDVEQWIGRLPPPPGPRRWWQFARGERRPPSIVHGPLDLAEVESWRRTHPPTGKTTPADWFVWSTKPAQHPFLTRFGGVPHREASEPWPRDARGRPLLFVGQICFMDSKDIVDPAVPGDVLLVFARLDDEGDYFGWEDYHVEWSASALREPLQPNGVPEQPVRVPRLNGVIHRTYEDWSNPKQGTKIGATTLVIQGSGDESILCALSFFSPRWEWPTLEHERLDRGEAAAIGEFELGDAGCIYVRHYDDGSLEAMSDCY